MSGRRTRTIEEPQVDPAPAELGAIGFVLRYPANFHLVAALRPNHFSDKARADLWALIRTLVEDRGATLTPQTVADRMVRAQLAPSMAAATAILVEAQDRLQDAGHPDKAGPAFLDDILDKALRRVAIDTSNDIRESARAAISREELRSEIQAHIYRFQAFETAATFVPLTALLEQESRRLEAAEGEATGLGLMSGIKALDDILINGIEPGEMCVVGARPSVGKTSLATQLAWRWSVEQGHAGLLESLEMKRPAIVRRMLAQASHLNLERVRKRDFGLGETDRYIAALKQLQEGAQHFELVGPERADGRIFPKNVTELVAEVRYHHNRRPLEYVIVDYIQLISGARRAGESREREVAGVSAMLKAMAQELNLAVLALSQLKRPEKGQEKKRPRMSELRESGSLEQDADIVILIHDYDYTADDEGNVKERHAGELIVDKNRNGRRGVAKVEFHAPTTRFGAWTEPYDVQPDWGRRPAEGAA